MTWPGEGDEALKQPSGRDLRAATGRFATGVTVLTARLDGEDHAMTANAFTSVSLDPLLVLVSVRTTARFHYPLLRAGQWGVSILPEGAEDIARWCATAGHRVGRQLDHDLFHRGPATGIALVSCAIATLECRTHAFYPGGDHTLVLGEVLAVSGSDAPPGTARPLVFYEGAYHTLATEWRP